jgi:hypothetical protein
LHTVCLKGAIDLGDQQIVIPLIEFIEDGLRTSKFSVNTVEAACLNGKLAAYRANFECGQVIRDTKLHTKK